MRFRKTLFIVLFVILSGIFSLSFCLAAETDITVINKDTEVNLTNPIVVNSNEYYISVDDLNKVNLGYEYVDGECYLVFRTNCSTSHGKTQIPFEDVFETEGLHYLSLEMLAAEYSDIYSIDYKNNTISLWINDYMVETYTVTVTLNDEIEIPDSGLDITVYSGTKSNIAGGIGYGVRRKNSENIGFEGTSVEMPEETDIAGLNGMTVKEEKTVTFKNNVRTADVKLDITVRNKYGNSTSGGGTGLTSYIGYYASSGGYIGGGNQAFDTNKKSVLLDVNSVYKERRIFGTVNVSESSRNVSYEIYAEGNVKTEYNDNGSYTYTCDKVFLTEGIIVAGETSVNYELEVICGLDYKVTIVFPDKEYLRKSVEVMDSNEDYRYDFDGILPANVVTGTIKLPDEMTEFKDYVLNDTLYEIKGKITLQQAEAPYYILDSGTFTIDTSVKNVEFSLFDVIGTDNVVVYYCLYDYVKDVHYEGIYKDNSNTAASNKSMKIISSKEKDIVVNIQPAKTVTVNLNCTSERPELYLNALGYRSSDEEGYVSITAEGEYNTVSESEFIGTFVFSLPEECDRYSLYFYNTDYGMSYEVVDGVCVNTGNSSDIYKADELTKTVFCNNSGKENFVMSGISGFSEDGAGLYLSNETAYDYFDLKCFLVLYDSNGSKVDLYVGSYDLESNSELNTTIKINNESIKNASYYRLFVWSSDLIPMSIKKYGDINN